ncbi:hypothetical protein AB0J80_08760 [Actinoplanes sp. NPDC049548]|uniref:hypothetical protein n=1 Tax=Actinoplanes sp. NPDC049548 TaxID=3155152 RepID=UPI00342D6B17
MTRAVAGLQAEDMAWIRVRDKALGRRLTVIEECRFPSSARQRFLFGHPGLSDAAVAIVEDGARQWFRLTARHPGAQLAMPSVAVNDLWHELVLQTQEYAQFCEDAFGRFLHYTPRDPQGPQLLETLRMARQDERCGDDQLPLLFRVDRETGVAGGRVYLADCGGRGECFPLAGLTCLHHAEGVERRTRRPWRFEKQVPPDSGTGGWEFCGGG